MSRVARQAGWFFIATMGMGLMGVSLAVTSSVNVTVTDPNEKPLKIQTLTLTPQGGGEAVTVENDDDDNKVAGLVLEGGQSYDVTAVDQDGKKHKGVLVVPTGGGPQDLTVAMTAVPAGETMGRGNGNATNWWQRRSTGEKVLIVGGGIAGGVLLANSGNGDNNNGNGGAAPQNGGGTQPTSSTTNFSVSCTATVDPQGSSKFGLPEILPNWVVMANGTGGGVVPVTITLKNGFLLSGSLQNGQVSVSGKGQLTGVNTTVKFDGNLHLDAGSLNGALWAGPPLGGGPTDQFGANCNGSVVSGP